MLRPNHLAPAAADSHSPEALLTARFKRKTKVCQLNKLQASDLQHVQHQQWQKESFQSNKRLCRQMSRMEEKKKKDIWQRCSSSSAGRSWSIALYERCPTSSMTLTEPHKHAATTNTEYRKFKNDEGKRTAALCIKTVSLFWLFTEVPGQKSGSMSGKMFARYSNTHLLHGTTCPKWKHFQISVLRAIWLRQVTKKTTLSTKISEKCMTEAAPKGNICGLFPFHVADLNMKNALSPLWLYDTPFFPSLFLLFLYLHSDTLSTLFRTCCSHNLEVNKGFFFYYWGLMMCSNRASL